ncbi:zinc-binding dehydrogenase [Alicyclobacillus sp. ALC3]|uniref:zinc-binding dehydrogenase n=1 Tax=Alicyclobacillus sp. ALC3 TaxID=2796143 RepID=UPI0023798326|nr:zinc-binding dehydrogenase [Alicyclobacillus sp. ALC3]WDL97622.1 alcohol dehydrogenase catalytic domain-containing protein [Alicyclobacillus sp. ALC3]
MRAVVIRKHGDLDVLVVEQDVPQPTIGDYDVRVEVKAVGLNYGLDTMVVRGLFGVVGKTSALLPRIPGADFAGVVTEVGSAVDNFKPGDRVLNDFTITCGDCQPCRAGRTNQCTRLNMVGVHRDGGAAEHVVLPSHKLRRIPDSLTYAEAAVIPVSFGTAWHMMVEIANVKPTDWVLVTAVGSGLGVAALQIAKLHGAHVIAAAGSDWKLERARELGADVLVNYSRESIATEALRATDGQGVNLVFDGGINQNNWLEYANCIAYGGRIVLSGTIGSDDGQLHIDIKTFYRKHIQMLGNCAYTASSLNSVIDEFEHGRLRPVVDSTFPLEQVQHAYAHLLERRAFGKVVLNV